MKIILSPAKKMVSDTDSLAPVNVPQHMDQTAEKYLTMRCLQR